MRHSPLCCLAIVLVAGCGQEDFDESESWAITELPDGPAPAAPRVLFIGNSYTAVGSLWTQVAHLAGIEGRRVVLQGVDATIQGATLADHVRKGALDRIAQGPWDFVVIQGRGSEPLEDPGSFRDNAAILARAAREAGAQPVFLETWARREGHPDYAQEWTGGSQRTMQRRLRSAYRLAAAATGGLYAPAGDAWRLALLSNPSPPLYGADGAHPSAIGTYLNACVVASLLTHVIAFDDLPPATLSSAEAYVIQRAAAAVFGF